uniref:Uncharacterized protein n=1 Tax=Nicotiana tabacum TaxID=4097 RepID=A0A1S3ZP52_TOBAC|nr:PREDICTED: uncharacterized protein LOC107789060 [Nicotiana tabacum]
MAQMPNAVPQLKEWVEDLLSQRPYSECAWMELSKGRWEARLPKDVAMRPPSEGEDMPLESPTPKQGDEKKRKRVPSSLDSEKKKPNKRLARKAKEKEDNSELVAQVRTTLPRTEEVVEKALTGTCEPERGATALPQAREVERETGADTSRAEGGAPRDELREIDLTGSPQISDAMIARPVRQRLEQIRQLQAQVDAIQTEAEEFKKNMDLTTSQKEAVQAQLASAEAQLRAAKEKTSVQAKRIEELRSGLNSAISSQESLATELEAAKSDVVVANTKADAKVAQFKVDVEAIQAYANSMVDHARWEARRESIEGVYAQGFDILAKIENAKVEEAGARKLPFPEKGSESLTESEGREDPDDEDAAPDEDRAT